jgi:succinate dehydrogenase / fumarate reductase, membrane anchor subunit
VVALVALNFYTVAMAAFAIFAILKIAFTGGAA